MVIETNKLTIIIPTLNEEGNIKRIIGEILQLKKGYKIIVADDGSKDKTKQIVTNIIKKNGSIIFLDRSKQEVKGLTASVIDGIKKTKTEYFVVMDADLQHPPKKIIEIEKELIKNKVCIGTRNKLMVNWPLSRRIISKVATFLGQIKLIFNGIYCKDPMSGFFGGQTDLFKGIYKKNQKRFQMYGYKVLFDFLKCLPKKTKISQIGYDFGLRIKGESKIGKRQIKAFLKSIIS